MPLQYSQDDDGLLHALGLQEELDEAVATPESVVEHLRRIAGLMSESGGDFDAAITLRAAKLIEDSPFVNAAYDSEVTSLKEAVRSLLPILEGVRFTVGLGKTQLERIAYAKSLVTE